MKHSLDFQIVCTHIADHQWGELLSYQNPSSIFQESWIYHGWRDQFLLKRCSCKTIGRIKWFTKPKLPGSWLWINISQPRVCWLPNFPLTRRRQSLTGQGNWTRMSTGGRMKDEARNPVFWNEILSRFSISWLSVESCWQMILEPRAPQQKFTAIPRQLLLVE